MKHFTQHLIDLGYEPWRCSYIFTTQNPDAKNQNNYIINNTKKENIVFKDNGIFYFKSAQPYYDFSTMRVGGLCTHWVKDNDFENSIIWGLNEHDKPPTLIYPRPIVTVKRFVDGKPTFICGNFDDTINIFLKKESNEKIYESLFDKSIKFHYDETKD